MIWFYALMFLWSDLLPAHTNYLYCTRLLRYTPLNMCMHAHAQTQAENMSIIICSSYISSIAEKQVLEDIFFNGCHKSLAVWGQFLPGIVAFKRHLSFSLNVELWKLAPKSHRASCMHISISLKNGSRSDFWPRQKAKRRHGFFPHWRTHSWTAILE